MQIEFERRVQLIAPELIVDEKLNSDTIFTFLNAYQKRYVVTNYLTLDQTQTDTRVQKKVSDAIKGLIVTQTLTDSAKIDDHTNGFELPSNYLLYIRSSINIDSSLTNTQGITPAIYIKEEEVNLVKPSAFDTTAIIRTPYVVVNSGIVNDGKLQLEVIHDKFTTVSKVNLTYCREPKQFNILHADNITIFPYCEMPENIHLELVEGAVDMFITEARYRLQRKEPNQ